MAEMSLADLAQYLGQGMSNGARSFGDQAKWALGGMNGPQPETYAGGPTANQYVSSNFPQDQPSLAALGQQYDPNMPPEAYADPRLQKVFSGMANGMAQHMSTPGAAMAPNRYPAGTEEAAWYDQNREGAMAQWAPQMALSMLGAGAPMAEAGALGAGGGRLRNQFTGAFRKEGETPLPGNPYRSVNTQAQPVAANSAAVVNRMQAPAAADPALMQQNLARMDNPMSQQMQPPPAANPADVAQWRQLLINSFGMK